MFIVQIWKNINVNISNFQCHSQKLESFVQIWKNINVNISNFQCDSQKLESFVMYVKVQYLSLNVNFIHMV